MAIIEKLNAIGEAIREKTGKTEKMTLEQMPVEIASIEGGGGAPANPVIEALSVTENGTYEAPSGVDGYSPVNVNVPIPEGYIKPSGTINITENGTYNVTEKESAVVNVAGGTNSESEEVAGLLDNTMTVLDNSLVTSLRTRACQNATKLATVNLPNVTTLGAYAFYQCTGLITCTVPKLKSLSTQTWYMCNQLQYADCGQLGNMTAQTFASCNSLKTLILRKTDGICTLSNTNAISGSGIGKGNGYIYVPRTLIETYVANANWASVATAEQFRALEDYTVDGTIAGELDESKI